MTAGPLAARAEVLRLARLLRVAPESLGDLERLPLDDLRLLRDQVTDALFDHDDHSYDRLAASVALLPGALVATIAQKAFGPMLCARVAGRLETKRAVDIAGRLPAPFLAELCTELDPRRAGRIIERLATERIVLIASELLARGEHVTTAAFVGHVDDVTLDAVIAVSTDDDLLRIAFVVDDIDALDTLVARIDEDRLRGILRVALHGDLWVAGLALLGALSEVGQARALALLEDELRVAPASIRKRALALAEDLGVMEALGSLRAALEAE